MAIVSPSLLSADFLHLADEITMINESQCDWLHIDVMDGEALGEERKGLADHLSGERPALLVECYRVVLCERCVNGLPVEGYGTTVVYLSTLPRSGCLA